ncbi:hypothetical protein P280DRAFT_520386 [Massarina eburnea CBS 473.64]|uniref:Uncharacterized protein n=1 Tax=Massarina eburnea CBS 473.64 TaxID=1395130 RepID=A0A6A6RVD7_9PLEO|nr:hypothetical protein P280DRAFT_520386 [Massarina eburnea CBS 473.64]
MSTSAREKLTPPPSPLQRMKTPFTRHLSPGPVSLRARMKMRIGILVLCATFSIAVLNELRCAKYGCVSRVGFYGEDGRVGGGSVLPKETEDGDGETGAVLTSEDAQKMVEVQFGQGGLMGEGKEKGEEGKWVGDEKEGKAKGGKHKFVGWMDKVKDRTASTSTKPKKVKTAVKSPSPVADVKEPHYAIISSPSPLSSVNSPSPTVAAIRLKTNTTSSPKHAPESAPHDHDHAVDKMNSHIIPKPKSHHSIFHTNPIPSAYTADVAYMEDEEDYVKGGKEQEHGNGHESDGMDDVDGIDRSETVTVEAGVTVPLKASKVVATVPSVNVPLAKSVAAMPALPAQGRPGDDGNAMGFGSMGLSGYSENSWL